MSVRMGGVNKKRRAKCAAYKFREETRSDRSLCLTRKLCPSVTTSTVTERTMVGIVARIVSVRGKGLRLVERLYHPVNEQRRRIRGVSRKT